MLIKLSRKNKYSIYNNMYVGVSVYLTVKFMQTNFEERYDQQMSQK